MEMVPIMCVREYILGLNNTNCFSLWWADAEEHKIANCYAGVSYLLLNFPYMANK